MFIKRPEIQGLLIAMDLLRALPLILLAECVLSSTLVLHESISNVPPGFKASGSPSPTQEINLFIALVQSDITGLAKVVDAVSIPSSSSYGQYLTAAEVSFIRPICFESAYTVLFH
jgi:tripeptidyl-peptidase-1